MYWGLLAVYTVGARKSLQLALLLLPARWKQRVIGPVGLGMVPRSACRTETMGIPAVPDRASRPVGPGTVSYFAAFALQNLCKPWDSRLFPTGLGPQGETPRAKIVRTTVVPSNKTAHILSKHWGLLAVHTVARLTSAN